MNLKLLNNYIAEVKREIVDSGFKRDLDDYIKSIPANNGNIVTLRKMAEDIQGYLNGIYSGDVPRYLQSLVPEELGDPFTKVDYLDGLNKLLADPNVKLEDFAAALLGMLQKLSVRVDSDVKSIDSLQQFIKPYARGKEVSGREDDAVVSLIFHDDLTIHSLDHLTKSLANWNRLLPVYHQLIHSGSPEDVRIVGVESGSIDLIINLNLDVSLNLVEAMKVGMFAFGAYLSYKKGLAPLVKTYVNKRLIELEKEKDVLLLENIGQAVRMEIEKQHEKAVKDNPGVSKEAAAKKIEQVAKLFTSHIIKGNDVKLLALPEEVAEGVAQRADESREELRSISLETRHQLSAISGSARHDLLEMYGAEEIKEHEKGTAGPKKTAAKKAAKS